MKIFEQDFDQKRRKNEPGSRGTRKVERALHASEQHELCRNAERDLL